VETRALYCPETNNNLEQQSDNGNSSIAQKWERIEAAITTAANKIIGNNTNKRQNEWFDEECKELIREKNEVRQKLFKEAQERTGRNTPR
jgi:hypothetical protein